MEDKIISDEKFFKIAERTRTINNQKIDRKIVKMNDNAIIVAVYDVETNKVLLNREYRVGPDKVVNGLVAGKINKGEYPREAMMRELREEASVDVRGATIISIDGHYTSEGFCDEIIYPFIVLGRNFKKIQASQDEDEHVEHAWVDFDGIGNYEITGLPAEFTLLMLQKVLGKLK